MKTVKDSKGIIYKKTADGTCYEESTNDEIIRILEQAKAKRQRIRLFYGDIKTGMDWKEEHDIIGTIGRSTGTIKIPLLMRKINSYGGGGILTDCIVKITINKKTVYQHPKYRLYNRSTGISKGQNIEYSYCVHIDDQLQAQFKTKEKAENYLLFLKGERNKI